MSEQLTDLARRYLLETCPLVGAEALRIIDGQAAELAALVAQLEAIRNETESVIGSYKHPDQLEQAVFKAFERITGLVSAVPSSLTRAALVAQLEAEKRDHSALRGAVCRREESMAEQRLTLVAQVAELTRERDEALSAYDAEVIGRREEVTGCHAEMGKLRAEVARLTEALAAAERDSKFWTGKCDQLVERVKAAEARVRKLEKRYAQR